MSTLLHQIICVSSTEKAYISVKCKTKTMFESHTGKFIQLLFMEGFLVPRNIERSFYIPCSSYIFRFRSLFAHSYNIVLLTAIQLTYNCLLLIQCLRRWPNIGPTLDNDSSSASLRTISVLKSASHGIGKYAARGEIFQKNTSTHSVLIISGQG